MADDDQSNGEFHGSPRTNPQKAPHDEDHSHGSVHTPPRGGPEGPDDGGPPARQTGPDSTTDEDFLRDLVESDAVPNEDGDPVFESPWQARAFGLAVSMRGGDGPLEWKSFQERLAAEMEATPGSDDPETLEDEYYLQWLSALERLLVDEGVLTEERLRRRAAAFADGDRTAAEFVEGHHEH